MGFGFTQGGATIMGKRDQDANRKRDANEERNFFIAVLNNARTVQEKIDKLKELSVGPDYRPFWDYARIVVTTFKETKPLLKVDRERLWLEYEELCQDVKKTMAQRDEMIKENASKIKEELGGLRYNHLTSDSPTFVPITGMPKYHAKEFWEHAKQISRMFKELKLSKDDRNQLWSTFQGLCEEVRSQQNKLLAESSRNRELISSLINDAYWHGTNPGTKEALDEARAMQTENLKRIKESVFTKEDKDALWDQWRQANEKIHWGSVGLRESNFLNARQEARRCQEQAFYGDPHQAIKDVKELHGGLRGQYMDKDQRNETQESISLAWEKAMERIQEKNNEKNVKHNEWQQRQEDHIRRWENNIKKAEGYIENLESQIEKLQDQVDDARTDEFADRLRDWIKEKELKIMDVRGSIHDFEDKIYSVRDRLK